MQLEKPTTRRGLPSGYLLEMRGPSVLTGAELDVILEILKRGAAVSIPSAKNEIPHATTLILLKNDRRIVGLGDQYGRRRYLAR